MLQNIALHWLVFTKKTQFKSSGSMKKCITIVMEKLQYSLRLRSMRIDTL